MSHHLVKTRQVVPFICVCVLLLISGAAPVRAQAPDTALVVTASVQPNPAPLGEDVAISATVFNPTNESRTFGVSGCPVEWEIPDYHPGWACPEIWTEITLAPGESRVFSAADHPELLHRPQDYPLVPGEVEFSIRVGSAGGTRALLTVLPPEVPLGHVYGRILSDQGWGTFNVPVWLAGTDTTAAGVDSFEVTTGDQGWFFLGGIRPGSYMMSTPLDNGSMWFYPGTHEIENAEPVHAEGGRLSGPFVLTLPPNDPPPQDQVLSGRVSHAGQVLPGAVVSAVVLQSLVPEYPDIPVFEEGIFSAETDGEGMFEIPVHPGVYILLAGKPSQYSYEYWGDGSTWETAEPIEVWPGTPRPDRFYEFNLNEIPPETMIVTGTVMGFHPFHDGPPEPLPDVAVRFTSLLPLRERVLLQTSTSSDGTYKFPLPPGTPYRVSFHRDDYYSQWFDQAEMPAAALPLDMKPGDIRTGVDALLQPNGIGSGLGSITGQVHIQVSPEDCDLPEGCSSKPLAGALVRVSAAYPTFAPYERTTRTDSLGRFTVTHLTADAHGTLSYYVMAEHPQANPGWYPGGVSFEHAEPVPVYSDQTVHVGVLTLSPASPFEFGVLGGFVHDLSGEPLGGALVIAYDAGDSPRTHPGSLTTWSTRTDSHGFWNMRIPLRNSVVVLAESHGTIPGYYSENSETAVYEWTQASVVRSCGPTALCAPIGIVLAPQPAQGPFIQAGRISRANDLVPFTVSLGDEPRARAQAHHVQNLPHSVFYLIRSETLGPQDVVVAGGVTGDNGVAVLTGLPEGVYFAYGDRPGFHKDYFTAARSLVPLVLNGSTPAVYATIDLDPVALRDFGDPTEPVSRLLSSPNPFTEATQIQYTLKDPGRVTLELYDLQGRLVKRLIRNELQVSGDHRVPWSGLDETGARAASGVYFVRVSMAEGASSHKIVLTR